ncbi:MAG: translation elongation factor Ts [Rhodothermaceae bacterium]|nr:translation elongation factor Ts [Rhodothermaceae bacterium]
MTITAKDVKRLRDATDAGMMDCKKALIEANGDFDAAIDVLRKQGLKKADKRADREAKEGLIVTAVNDDHSKGIIAEVNCETDFVARGEVFETFAKRIAEIAISELPDNLEGLKSLPFDNQDTIESASVAITGKVGEKIEVRKYQKLESSEANGIVAYMHPGSRLGVLVKMSGNGSKADAGRDVAMQVAALNPVATTAEEVPEEVKQKELEIAREVAVKEGKPENIVERIAEGKLKRYYKDHVLIEQPFVKDSSLTVKEMLKKADVEVQTYLRFALGD